MEMVTVILGPDNTELEIEKEQLLQLGYYQRMFASGMSEAQTGIIDHTDIAQDTYMLFVTWLRFGEIPAPTATLDEAAEKAAIQTRLELYYLADRFFIDNLLDPALDAILLAYKKSGLTYVDRRPDIEDILSCYSKTQTQHVRPLQGLRCLMTMFLKYEVYYSRKRDDNVPRQPHWPTYTSTEDLVAAFTQCPELLGDFIETLRDQVLDIPQHAPPGSAGRIRSPHNHPNCAFHTHKAEYLPKKCLGYMGGCVGCRRPGPDPCTNDHELKGEGEGEEDEEENEEEEEEDEEGEVASWV
jgi:hypothetical protein